MLTNSNAAHPDELLSDAHAAALRAEDARQAAVSSFALDDESPAAEAARAALDEVIPGLDEVTTMQRALPPGAALLWPDGTIARYAHA